MNSSSSAHPNPEAHNTDHDPAGLGDLEQAILRMVWQQRQATAEQVREQLSAAGRVLKESTVRTVLRRLEEKGYLTHHVEGRTFIYKAADRRQNVAARAVKNIIDRFCGGSAEELVLGMVDNEVLDHRQLERLAGKIAERSATGQIGAGRKERKP